MTKKDNIIFKEGKEKFLINLFNTSNFGYLAVGYIDTAQEGNTNGFEDPDSFHEIEESSYTRVPLTFQSIVPSVDDDETVTARFTAELEMDNIITTTNINQIAIVDSEIPGDPATTMFGASVMTEWEKDEQLAMIIEILISM